MLGHASERLTGFGARVEVRCFDLSSTEWLTDLDSPDCVLASLSLHHISGADKRRLFAAVYGTLSDRGAFLIADLVQPQRPEAMKLYAEAYDRIAEAQSLSKTGSTHLFDRLVEEEWNYYRFHDSEEQPSPLFD